ncbi:YciI family protein [Kribbella sp. NPDC050241]|uniref:YciI family protein n=1 Tax=Kribbella sp. NPDC050241 TaxID=3364115 RepID=UPI003793FA8B
MRYLVSAIDDETSSAGPGDPHAPGAYNSRLEAAGHLVFVGGLAAPGTATVIDNRNGKPLFTDGPYLESKEYLGGFWVIEVPDLDTAHRLAAEASKACNRKVEVRPFQ